MNDQNALHLASSTETDSLWTYRQAAQWLAMTDQALRRMVRRGHVPSECIARLGRRRIRFRSDNLRAWVKRLSA